MNNEERVTLRRIGLGLCGAILGFLLLAWVFSALGCWTAHSGRILPCAAEVWWKGRP